MKKQHFRPQRRSETYDPNDAFVAIKVYLPRGTVEILKKSSHELQMPVSRLVALAVDNELDALSPFHYPCPMPTAPYVEYAYVEEAAKIMRFLEKFPQGTTIETLMLCRRDFGIKDRNTLMLAHRELLEKDLTEEFQYASGRLGYGPECKRVRVKGVDPKKLRRVKYDRTEGVSLKHLPTIRDEDVGDPDEE